MSIPEFHQTSKPFQTLDRCASYPYRRSEYIRRILWQMVEKTLFRFSLPRAFRWRSWLLRLFGAKLGHHTYIRSSVQIFHPWLLNMDDWSTLAANVVIYNLGSVKIGTHTVISQGSYLCAGTHDYTRPDLPLLRPSIQVGNGVWIAAQTFIGPGSIIGDNSVIGARAVVTGKIPPNVVAAGNPARVVKPRNMIHPLPESS